MCRTEQVAERDQIYIPFAWDSVKQLEMDILDVDESDTFHGGAGALSMVQNELCWENFKFDLRCHFAYLFLYMFSYISISIFLCAV